MNDSYKQDAPFTIKGHWWLPGSELRVAGDLIYDEEEMTLELYGGLNEAICDSPFGGKPEADEFPMIYGESLANESITLLRSFYTNWRPDIRSFRVQPDTRVAIRSAKLNCGTMLLGSHISSPNDTFSKCRIEIPSFESWLGDSPFTADVEGQFDTFHLKYTRPQGEEFKLLKAQCEVRFLRAVRPPGFPDHSPRIEHRAYAEVEPTVPCPLTWFASRANELLDLFSLFFGQSMSSRSLSLHQSGTHGTATVFYSRHKAKIKDVTSMEIPLRYEMVKAHFQLILENWFTPSRNAMHASRMLVSSERRPSSFIEFRFLPLVHAAEVLSQSTDGATIIPTPEYRSLVKRIKEVIPTDAPKELLDSITNSLGHANGRTLRRKLLKMLERLQDETCRLFCVDRSAFVTGVVDTRNHFTHYSTERGKKILQGVELHWAIRKLSVMLRVLLLLDAGIPEEILQKAIGSDFRLNGERRVWCGITEEGSEFEGPILD